MKASKILLSGILFQTIVVGVFGQKPPVKVDLTSHGNALNATFYSASATKPGPVVILLHGWPGNADNPLGLALKICERGVNVLVFNYRGTYGSEGFTSLKNSAEDIPEAIRFLKQKSIVEKFAIDTSQIIVAGYSYGGGAMWAAALHFQGIKRLISIAGADMSVFIRMLTSDPQFRNNFEERMRKSSAEGGFAKVQGDISASNDSLISNVDYFDPVKNVDLLKNKEILFIVGWDDTTGKMEENALPIYRRLKEIKASNVSIIAFPDNHSFINSRDELAQAIVKWVRKE